jgi:hypothetical protein
MDGKPASSSFQGSASWMPKVTLYSDATLAVGIFACIQMLVLFSIVSMLFRFLRDYAQRRDDSLALAGSETQTAPGHSERDEV